MIIENQEQITEAVLSELKRIKDPRLKELVSATVRHMHDLAREVNLTETEFRQACAFIARLGQKTNESHNEVVLLAGSLGLSSLVCLLNNGQGKNETTANLLGPFWRMDSPLTKNGDSIVRSPIDGPALFVNAWIKDIHGEPVVDAEVDVWNTSAEGFYENQDPGQAEMNLRGKFRSDQHGQISFQTIKPMAYPIPVDGPVGDLLRAQGRSNMRPAHVHFLIHKPGFKTHISQVYANDDPHLETDVQFGVTRKLVGNFVRHQNEKPPSNSANEPETITRKDWYSLDYTFTIEPGEALLPKPPITEKTQDTEKPNLEILERLK